MTDDELLKLRDRFQGYWTSWKVTPERLAIIKKLFGGYVLSDVTRIMHTWFSENPDTIRPKLKDILALVQQSYQEVKPDDSWSPGEETELAFLQEQYPGVLDEQLIRLHMNREPPPEYKRRSIVDKMLKWGTMTITETRKRQEEQSALFDNQEQKNGQG